MQHQGSEFSLTFGRALGKVIVSVYGAVDAQNAPQLRDRLIDLIDGQGNRHLVLDLSEMTLIDATGLSVFVDALKRIRRMAGKLVLSGPGPHIVREFEAAGLDRVFEITPAWSHPSYGYGRTGTIRPQGWGRSG